jgi:hypothetical protein
MCISQNEELAWQIAMHEYFLPDASPFDKIRRRSLLRCAAKIRSIEACGKIAQNPKGALGSSSFKQEHIEAIRKLEIPRSLQDAGTGQGASARDWRAEARRKKRL